MKTIFKRFFALVLIAILAIPCVLIACILSIASIPCSYIVKGEVELTDFFEVFLDMAIDILDKGSQ